MLLFISHCFYGYMLYSLLLIKKIKGLKFRFFSIYKKVFTENETKLLVQ
jgi:hypothetical protein